MCPHHRDSADPLGTRCTRTGQYSTPESREILVRQLKLWSLRGRTVQHRAQKGLGGNHKSISFVPESELPSDGDLNQQLREARMSAEWLQPLEVTQDADDSGQETEYDVS
jgi:hypothetical protein